MNYPKTMAANITARYDAMREIRDAKDRLKALESQWSDIVDEVKQQDVLVWIDFCYGGKDVKIKTWEHIQIEWEKANPGWKVMNNGLRKIPLLNAGGMARELAAQKPESTRDAHAVG